MTVMINMFLFKFYSEVFYDAMTFFIIGVPMMAYLVGNVFFNLLEFIKQLHLDDLAGVNDDENTPIVTPLQQRLLVRVIRDLSAYFGIYYLTAQLDNVMELKMDALEKI